MPTASDDATVIIRELELAVDGLQALPERMTALETRVGSLGEQILQLRTEMKVEFSAVRAEMRTGDEQLRLEMRALNQETLTQMRVLHEELIERIARLDEGRDRGPGTSRRR